MIVIARDLQADSDGAAIYQHTIAQPSPSHGTDDWPESAENTEADFATILSRQPGRRDLVAAGVAVSCAAAWILTAALTAVAAMVNVSLTVIALLLVGIVVLALIIRRGLSKGRPD
jgi:Flp pilus assembly protein TadB